MDPSSTGNRQRQSAQSLETGLTENEPTKGGDADNWNHDHQSPRRNFANAYSSRDLPRKLIYSLQGMLSVLSSSWDVIRTRA